MTDSHSSSRPISPLLTSAFDTGFDAEHALQVLLQAGVADSAEAALLRVILLRRDYPDAQIVTDLVQHEGRADSGMIVRATITLPTGAMACGYADSDAGNESSGLEETERRAIGRALDILGHTVIVAQSTTVEAPRAPERQSTQVAATGVTVTAPPTSNALRSEPELDEEADTQPVSPPEPVSGQAQSQPQPPSVVDAMRRANLRRRPQGGPAGPQEEDLPPEDTFRAPPPMRQRPESTPPPSSAAAPAVTSEEKEPALEDYSWTAFWRVARPQGFNKVKVEERIGRSIDGMTPIQVREALAETGITL